MKLFKPGIALEWHEDGETASYMGNDTDLLLEPKYYMLMLYPRDFTAVCTKEIVELQKELKRFDTSLNCMTMVGSVDSPETHAVFYSHTDYFEHKIEIPAVTINPDHLTDEARPLVWDKERGNTRRITLWVSEGELVDHYHTDYNLARDIDETVRKHLYLFGDDSG